MRAEDPGVKPGWKLPNVPRESESTRTSSSCSFNAALRAKSQRTPIEVVCCCGMRPSVALSDWLRKAAVAAACGGKPASGRPASEVALSAFIAAYVRYGVHLPKRCPPLTYHALFEPSTECVSNFAHSAVTNQRPGS